MSGPSNTTSLNRTSDLFKNLPRLQGEELSSEIALGQTLKFLAHQGAQGIFPGNSLAAIERAIGVADCVEFDVYTATRADGKQEVVVIHPEGYFLHVNHAGMKNEAPLPLSYEDCLSQEVHGARLIPTLNQVLDSYVRLSSERGKRSEIHIELKGPGTAEAVLPLMQERVKRGEISYQDFALTALCSPGDRSRILAARALDPQVRVAFVARGGDFAVDGFNGLDDAIEFAKSINADTFIVTRRELNRAIVNKIREAGFLVGCFHCRTSDEAEASISLGADYVAADFFCGASILSYPGAYPVGSPLFERLQALEFYKPRDWIWEIGSECEKTSQNITTTKVESHPSLRERPGVVIDESGQIILSSSLKGVPNRDPIDFTLVQINPQYIGALELSVTGASETGPSWGQILNVHNQENLFLALAEKSGILPPKAVAGGISLAEIARGPQEGFTSRNLTPLQNEDLKELARSFLVRQGRLIGVLAFTSLAPRHGTSDEYSIEIVAPLIKQSEWMALGCRQQVEAQGLRSGKRCSIEIL